MESSELGGGQAVEAVLDALLEEGPLEGRVRIQKLIYLLKAGGVHELSSVPFRYHHYGPYSDVVATALGMAVARGAVLESSVSFDEEWQRYEYARGNATGAANILSESSRASVQRVVRASGGLGWRTLEIAATIAFFVHERGSDLQQAIQETIERKPHGENQVGDAVKLLRHIDLVAVA